MTTSTRPAWRINRANSGDEGSETAKRHVESLAKKYGVSTDELREVVANQVPVTFFQFTPDQVDMVESVEESVVETVVEMEACGMSLEAIAAVFIRIGNQIKAGRLADEVSDRMPTQPEPDVGVKVTDRKNPV